MLFAAVLTTVVHSLTHSDYSALILLVSLKFAVVRNLCSSCLLGVTQHRPLLIPGVIFDVSIKIPLSFRFLNTAVVFVVVDADQIL